MLAQLAWYVAITIVLALVDALRMKAKNKPPFTGGNNDISHPVSWTLAVITAAALYFILNGWNFDWHTATYALGCVGIRFLLFDLFLNIFVNFFVFPRPINYISGKSSSLNEDRLTHVGFWWRRLIAAGILAAALLINWFI